MWNKNELMPSTDPCVITIPPRAPNMSLSCCFVMQTFGRRNSTHLDYCSQTTEQERTYKKINTGFPTSGTKHCRQNIFHIVTAFQTATQWALFLGLQILCSIKQIVLDQTQNNKLSQVPDKSQEQF